MVRILYVTSFALAAVSAVSGSRIPYKMPPTGWNFELLEDYQKYHERYLNLDCEHRHGTHFFQTCCHPHLKNQTPDSHPSYCTPSSSRVEPSPSPSDDCADDDHHGGPQVTPSTSSEIPPPSSTAQKTSSPEPYRHAAAVSPPVATPVETTTSSPSPSPSPASTYVGYGTYFRQYNNPGACGQVHSDDDLIAAIDQARYGDSGARSSLCGKKVKITAVANGNAKVYDGHTVVVTIADDCPTCQSENSIDLSVAAFEKLAPLSVGLLDIKWSYE
ncbi:RlpA-like double-psi beta-barrel-protein domain-containing protein-containing protein [Lactifluus subvellereus]|nr:RlpA-like double-psi beta-barrel-protein domain-containing protein-containing protein [Lactifluus subvellereus]